MGCEHLHHEATVEVARLVEKEDDESAIGYAADIRIECTDGCGLPFGFRGLPVGAARRFPTVSVDARELRVPLMSPAELAMAGLFAGGDSPLQVALDLATEPCRNLPAAQARLVAAVSSAHGAGPVTACPPELAERCLTCRARDLVGRS